MFAIAKMYGKPSQTNNWKLCEYLKTAFHEMTIPTSSDNTGN